MAKIRFQPVSAFSADDLARNREYVRSLGFPGIKPGEVGAAAFHLAVVGGAPSVKDQLDELRAWGGEVMAVGEVWPYLRDQGIDATFYTIDPNGYAAEGVKKAVVADVVAKRTIDCLKDANVEVLEMGANAVQNFSTSAATVPMFAHWRGHKKVSFFGCDSSYEATSHAFRDELPDVAKLWVECGGNEYLTSPQMLMQAEELSATIRAFPNYLECRSGGFLSALVANGDYNVTHISPGIQEALERAS